MYVGRRTPVTGLQPPRKPRARIFVGPECVPVVRCSTIARRVFGSSWSGSDRPPAWRRPTAPQTSGPGFWKKRTRAQVGRIRWCCDSGCGFLCRCCAGGGRFRTPRIAIFSASQAGGLRTRAGLQTWAGGGAVGIPVLMSRAPTTRQGLAQLLYAWRCVTCRRCLGWAQGAVPDNLACNQFKLLGRGLMSGAR